MDKQNKGGGERLQEVQDGKRRGIWLAADYHFPSLYCCRVPMSSLAHARTLPAPGPATVRLALLRTSLELFGEAETRTDVFPIVRAAPIRIQPPERVAISQQLLQGYKWEKDRQTKKERITESIIQREMAHASGPMTVYLHIPVDQEKLYRTLFQAIGYWGQTDSLTMCGEVCQRSPLEEVCTHPLRLIGSHLSLEPFLGCTLSEFRDLLVSWDEIVTGLARSRSKPALTLEIYVWPLILLSAHHHGKQFARQGFDTRSLEPPGVESRA